MWSGSPLITKVACKRRGTSYTNNACDAGRAAYPTEKMSCFVRSSLGVEFSFPPKWRSGAGGRCPPHFAVPMPRAVFWKQTERHVYKRSEDDARRANRGDSTDADVVRRWDENADPSKLVRELAAASGTSRRTLARLEVGGIVSREAIEVVRSALETGGVTFTGYGVTRHGLAGGNDG